MQIPGLADDLDAVFEHAGDTVVIGGVTGKGSLRREAIEVATDSGGVNIIGKRYQLSVREGVFTVAQDVLAEVNGDDYYIENIGVVGPDGLRRLIVVEATS